MKFDLATPLLLVSAAQAAVTPRATVQGFDISNYQPNVDFAAAYKSGARFVMMKARSSLPKQYKKGGKENCNKSL